MKHFKWIRYILIVMAIFVLFFSLCQIYDYYSTSSKEKAYFDDIARDYVKIHKIKSNEKEKSFDNVLIDVNFDQLEKINKDIVAWLYCEDTPINYPVVQCDDNKKYLHCRFDSKYSESGTLFLDCRNNSKFTDFNSIIYGHSMKNDTMFGTLPDYKEQDYYDKHSIMWLATKENYYRIDLFAGCVFSSKDSDAWQLWFDSKEKQEKWLNDICRKSYFNSDVVPSINDRIITLSTCSYEYDGARFVLHGILNPVNIMK